MDDQFFKDLEKLKAENRKLAAKLLDLLTSIYENLDTPLGGIGNPEYLKHDLSKFMSRRISDKHRLVYKINENPPGVSLVSCYGHYNDK